jgi:hypothetical protein
MKFMPRQDIKFQRGSFAITACIDKGHAPLSAEKSSGQSKVLTDQQIVIFG